MVKQYFTAFVIKVENSKNEGRSFLMDVAHLVDEFSLLEKPL
jgi:hypothetical protein